MKFEITWDNNALYFERFPKLSFLISSDIERTEFEKRLSSLMEYVLKNPLAVSLVDTVLNTGSVSLKICPHGTMPASAYWDNIKRQISVADGYSDDAAFLDSFIFEMCNADNDALHNITVVSFSDSHEYAKQKELAEFHTAKRAYEISFAGVSNYGWPANYLSDSAVTLEKYLLSVSVPQLSHHGFSHQDGYVYSHLQYVIAKTEVDILEKKLTIAEKNVLLAQKKSGMDIESKKLEPEIQELKETQVRLEQEVIPLRNERLKMKDRVQQNLAELKQAESAKIEAHKKSLAEIKERSAAELQALKQRFDEEMKILETEHAKTLQKLIAQSGVRASSNENERMDTNTSCCSAILGFFKSTQILAAATVTEDRKQDARPTQKNVQSKKLS